MDFFSVNCVNRVLNTGLYISLLKIRVVISRDHVEGQSLLNELQDVAYRNASPGYARFPKVYVGIDCYSRGFAGGHISVWDGERQANLSGRTNRRG